MNFGCSHVALPNAAGSSYAAWPDVVGERCETVPPVIV